MARSVSNASQGSTKSKLQNIKKENFFAWFAKREWDTAPIVGPNALVKLPDEKGKLCNQFISSSGDVIGKITSHLEKIPQSVIKSFASDYGYRIVA